MSTIWAIIIITTIAGVGGTGLGGLLGACVRRDSQKMVSLLLSFAAGVMLAVVCFDLLPGAITPDGGQKVSIFVVIANLVLGYGVVYLLNYLIDRDTDREVPHINQKNHPRTADDLGELIHSKHYEEHKEKHSGLFTAGLVMACAIALHNVPEGIVIGASYAKDSTVLLGGSGFIMACVIGLHNVPEGMAVSVPLISGGDKRLHAVLLTALSGAPTVIGAIIGYYVGLISPVMLSMSLAFASGAMLYVVMGELMPEAILMWKSKLPAFAGLVGIIVGMIVIYL